MAESGQTSSDSPEGPSSVTEAAEEDRQQVTEVGGEAADTNQKTIREMLQEGSDKSVFVDRSLVEPDTIIDEDRIVGRDDQLETVISLLKPAIRGNRPPNMLLYGPAGTGKSLIINAVANQIIDLCNSKGVRFGVVNINCRPIKTLDRAVYRLVATVADDVGVDPGVPQTGVSTDRKWTRLYELVNANYDAVLFILDEIDLLIGTQSRKEPAFNDLLYQLSRAGKNNVIEGSVSVAALTNDPKFMEDLDARAESSFNPHDIPFPDYDANQLRAILKKRRDAFRSDALGDDVIPLTAAFAAQSHGDARKGIDLFREAGDLADRKGEDRVVERHVRASMDEVDKDRTMTQIQGLSTQKKISLFATSSVAHYGNLKNGKVPSPVGYSVYKWATERIDADQMTRETYVKYMKELSTYGMVSAQRRGQGRGAGMFMEFSFSDEAEDIMEEVMADTRLIDLENDESMLRSVIKSQLREFNSS